MSSALDQSLDEILSTKPKRNFQKKKQQIARSKVGKAVAKAKPAKKQQNTAAAAKPQKNVLDASYATKVVVYGLPKDIKQDAIKDFFANQVGGVASVALSYNEKGQSKGIATVIFRAAGNAAKAVEKYNGAPIDGGASKLKLELVIDPTKRPLASRISANVVQKQGPKKANDKNKPKAKEAKKEGPKKANNKPKNKRPAKKTVEQLDQEMADYFEKK